MCALFWCAQCIVTIQSVHINWSAGAVAQQALNGVLCYYNVLKPKQVVLEIFTRLLSFSKRGGIASGITIRFCVDS